MRAVRPKGDVRCTQDSQEAVIGKWLRNGAGQWPSALLTEPGLPAGRPIGLRRLKWSIQDCATLSLPASDFPASDALAGAPAMRSPLICGF